MPENQAIKIVLNYIMIKDYFDDQKPHVCTLSYRWYEVTCCCAHAPCQPHQVAVLLYKSGLACENKIVSGQFG